MTTIINGSSPSITFSDNTTQTSGYGAGTSQFVSSQMPTGSVLQVVNATYSTTVTNSTNTLADTGLTATITPKFSTSKILVIVHHPVRVNTGQIARFFLNRAGTNIVQLWQGWGYVSAMSAQMSTTYLDSPATTSATIYKTQFANPSATGVVYVSPDGSSDLSTITLMEIAA